jgi:hypothetical protein
MEGRRERYRYQSFFFDFVDDQGLWGKKDGRGKSENVDAKKVSF